MAEVNIQAEKIRSVKSALDGFFIKHHVGHGIGSIKKGELCLALRFQSAASMKKFDDAVESLPSNDPIRTQLQSVPIDKQVIGVVRLL